MQLCEEAKDAPRYVAALGPTRGDSTRKDAVEVESPVDRLFRDE